MSDSFVKDPDAVLDYSFSWVDWLAEGETIVAFEVTPAGVTLDSASHDAGVVTAWVSGGTLRTPASLTCRITTSQGRVDDRTITLRVRER